MKINCESCGAQYDLDPARIPPSGLKMKCPACLHAFTVQRPGAAPAASAALDAPTVQTQAPKPREIALSPLSDGPADDDSIDLPAPKATHAAAAPPAIALAEDVVDLPAPVERKRPSAPSVSPPPALPRAAAPPPRVAAPPAAPRDEDLIDLPAPKRARPSGPMPVLKPEEPEPELPAPKRGPVALAVDLDAPDPDDAIALPPRPLRPSVPSIPSPTRPSAPSPLAAPPLHRDFAVGPPTVEEQGPPGLELEPIGIDAAIDSELDVVAPKTQASPPPAIPLDAELPAPRQEVMDLQPKAPKARTPTGGQPSLDDSTPVEGVPTQRAEADLIQLPAKKAARAEDADEEPPRRRLRALAAVGAVIVVVGGVGVGLGEFTNQGWFASNLWTGKRAANESKLNAARKLLSDDTLASYRRAAAELSATFAEGAPPEALALEAEAHLGAARLGVQSELKAADALLARLPEAERPEPEQLRARALRLVVGGRLAEARTQLAAILAAAPSDATGLTYLGWTELAAGDLPAAEVSFAHAVQAEPTRAAALYGQALAKERLGDAPKARELYGRALARSPQHFGALLGQARLTVGLEPGAVQARIEELIGKRASQVGPRELAEAWATVGQLAAQGGRRDEAEDRLKRAVALAPEVTLPRVLLAGVQCDQGKPGEAVASLSKIVAAEPKNLEARLGLARALVESGQPAEAAPVLAQAAALLPKEPRVLYWQGRVQATSGDKQKALELFQAATAADPRYLAAYLAQSTTLAQLGRADEGLAALQKAEAQAADDPSLMVQLGQAFAQLGKPAEAEARFRAALAKKPELELARVELGAALEAEGKLEDAQREYQAVADKHADYPGLAERQARLQLQLGKRDEAWALYQKALGQGVPTVSLRLQAARLALELGKAKEAQALAESVLKDDERSAPAQLTLARAQLALGHAEEALVAARRAATITDLPEAHFVLGRVLEQLGKLDQAVTEYGLGKKPPEGRERGELDGEASLGRARILVRMGATRDALVELGALTHDPKLRGPALLLVGDSYSDLGQRDKARHAYEDAAKAAPSLGEAAFKLGRALLDAGRRKPAAAELARALALGGDRAPFAAEAWLLAGDAYREDKQNELAVRAYKKYLELAPPESPQRAEVSRHLSSLGGN